MKSLSVFILIFFFSRISFAQYYYQDIIATQQANNKWKLYKINKVKSVSISSLESNGQPTEGFACRQNLTKDFSKMTTYTKTDFSRETFLTSFYNENGWLQNTIDTGKNYISTTEYAYNESGNVVSVVNTSAETESGRTDKEEHLWKYNSAGKPIGMTKIKNNSDSTFIRFLIDEKSNITEEHAFRNNIELPVVYYYYDDSNRLTDIVRYNEKAKRLLPDYIFSYNDKSQLIAMIYIPEGSTDYQKWVYDYNATGLRVNETCYNKQKELIGKIEYQYGFL
ncbi:MAG TPA: hypothetical protein VMT76_16100 [Puia sp.]|nr:hypothetical protein [Puia sp.]